MENLLGITGHEEAIDGIVAHHRSHLDAGATPKDVARLLESAQALLVRLLTRVRTIPFDAPGLGRTLSDFDVRTCRSEARLEGILATLHRALAARGGAGDRVTVRGPWSYPIRRVIGYDREQLRRADPLGKRGHFVKRVRTGRFSFSWSGKGAN
ncbi:hypothetical protein [Limimaricola litoreus]|uniref:hypothetical protein n=1 Tax=Limimaricola litoreus TaxID=2955316 RepID=UPI00209EE78F|nr:hypothetical protein [Limimaricola litoreus]